MTTVYDFSAATLDGEQLPLKTFEGKVLLVVNTASACGFTPQYEQLEALQRSLGPRGFSVLGFPCNQFGGQEPGNAQEIAEFCTSKYDVTFPMFGKVDVNGDNALPLFDYLKKRTAGVPRLESDQMEFHEIPGRSRREGGCAARLDHDAAGADQRDRTTPLGPDA